MCIVKEEIFGPVLVVQKFKDEEDAIQKANDSIYGLAGAVFTEDMDLAKRVISKLRAGITWINSYHLAYVEGPWGGYKAKWHRQSVRCCWTGALYGNEANQYPPACKSGRVVCELIEQNVLYKLFIRGYAHENSGQRSVIKNRATRSNE